jgi:hypothetical protein
VRRARRVDFLWRRYLERAKQLEALIRGRVTSGAAEVKLLGPEPTLLEQGRPADELLCDGGRAHHPILTPLEPLDEIIIDGDDIHRDTVNVAAWPEGLAEPNAIYMSRVVRDHVRDRLEAGVPPKSAGRANLAQFHGVIAIAEPAVAGRAVRWRQEYKGGLRGLRGLRGDRILANPETEGSVHRDGEHNIRRTVRQGAAVPLGEAEHGRLETVVGARPAAPSLPAAYS